MQKLEATGAAHRQEGVEAQRHMPKENLEMKGDLMIDRQQRNRHELQCVVDQEYEDLEFEECYFEPAVLNELLERGIEPDQPTRANPGSEEKVLTLSARYAAGLPLWHKGDRYEREDSAEATDY